MKTLCVYATHEPSFNLNFFIKHGVNDNPNIDYYFILNNPTMKLVVPGATVVNRENKNGDFGAWSHLLLTENIDGTKMWEKYDRFVLINSTIRGPFFPVWQKDKNWVSLFTDRLNETVKLVGITIGWDGYPPHVNSMLLVMDRVSMNLSIEAGIFCNEERSYSHEVLISEKEVELSRLILNSGYNIACMLKALEGIDFRQNRDIRNYSFFLRSHYYGIDVHPYETIFIKTKSQVGIYERTANITRATLWADENQSLDQEPFDWRAYLLNHEDILNAGFRTERQALEHFRLHGKYEARIYHPVHFPGTFYTIDLNARLYHGFVNQIYCLLNAIIIGHYTGRAISVDGFYTNYNSKTQIHIGEVIDIDRLNLLLAKLGLSTSVGHGGWYYRPKKSKYKDWQIEGSPIEVFQKLREETGHAIDLGNVFFFMIQRSLDPHLENLFNELLVNVPWTEHLQDVASSIKTMLGLDEYLSVHLRLEDDIVAHGGDFDPEKLRRNYLLSINRNATCDKKVFIATNLGKTKNRYNFMIENLKLEYPNLVTSIGWRDKFSGVPEGREMDAIIDYIICQGGHTFIGYPSSTFSEALSLCFTKNERTAIDCTMEDHLREYFTVISSHVFHGKLALDHGLGHISTYNGTLTSKIPLDEEEILTLGAHAPSLVKIRLNIPMTIRGYCSPTAENSPTMTFYCDDQIVGKVSQAGQKTESLPLLEGEHILLIQTSSIRWAHSVWLLKPS